MQELTDCVRGRSPQVAKEEFDDLRPAHRTTCPRGCGIVVSLDLGRSPCVGSNPTMYEYHLEALPFVDLQTAQDRSDEVHIVIGVGLLQVCSEVHEDDHCCLGAMLGIFKSVQDG
ncbi:hypothetical protein E2C01_028208 [Portunus trituberculatus]|uniref:Uncharacterized protein n=1 Tax=Portunus trituberculatus TaxID=210409 RepID=A0A5B7ENK7_PORTR|nr:hypothetical protein [Portunus trituberculatus]